MEDTVFIKVLEHGEQVGLEGTTPTDLKRHIEKELDIDLDHTDHQSKKESLDNIFYECFRNVDGRKHGRNHILKTEYYFRLIEYRELQEARSASKSANRNAFMAIGLSIFAILVSAILPLTQLNTPVSISKADFQELIKTANSEQEVKLDRLQMARILSAIESLQLEPIPQKSKAILPSNEVQHHDLINRYFEEQQ